MQKTLKVTPVHTPFVPNGAVLYPRSIHKTEDEKIVYMIQKEAVNYLIAPKEAGFMGQLLQTPTGQTLTLAPLTHENAFRMRELFPFTAPKNVLNEKSTIGLGDRLGIATPGQLRAISQYDVTPVLAQQSVRELTLTGRSFMDVLDCASFAVFQEDFQKGFGADGDHLKKEEEIKEALSCGYTMITLDCSEYIHHEVARMSDAEVQAVYRSDSKMEAEYIGKTFLIAGKPISFPEEEYRRIILIYADAIDFITQIYQKYIERSGVDFEISIDETDTPTTPQQHFLIAHELHRRGVSFATIAPHFCGEFQKGVDYIGNLEQFTDELKVHAAIAEEMQYKISVHSGSDKFSVFPVVGTCTGKKFHLKTAGTSWLVAMELISQKAPSLYRNIHEFARSVFDEARKFYHVTTDINRIPDINTLRDEELPNLFQQSDTRQLIHITYGFILNERNDDGSFRFKDKLYQLWGEYAEDYAQHLEKHIGRHLELLLGKPQSR